jgi:hypothetical protein
VSAVVSAFLTSRRERNSWLRERQTEAYEQLNVVLGPAVSNLTTGVTATALQKVNFDQLDEGYDDGVEVMKPAISSINRMAVVGGDYTSPAVGFFFAYYYQLLSLATPVSGAIHREALLQRQRAIELIMGLYADTIVAMRLDQRLVPRRRKFEYAQDLAFARKQRFLPKRVAVSKNALEAQAMTARVPNSDARQFLINWRVRTWNSVIPNQSTTYELASDDPYVEILGNLAGHVVDQPAGVLAKVTDQPWAFAFIGTLESSAQERILADVAEIVRTGAHETTTLFGGQESVHEEVDDGNGKIVVRRIWFWGDSSGLSARS